MLKRLSLLVLSGILSLSYLSAQPFQPLCIENRTFRKLTIRVDMDKTTCIDRTALDETSWAYQFPGEGLLATEVRLYHHDTYGDVAYIGIYLAHPEPVLLDERLYSFNEAPCVLPRSWSSQPAYGRAVHNMYSRAYFEARSQREGVSEDGHVADEETGLLAILSNTARRAGVVVRGFANNVAERLLPSPLRQRLANVGFVEREVDEGEQVSIANRISFRVVEEDQGCRYGFSVKYVDSTLCRLCCPSCCVYDEGVHVDYDTTCCAWSTCLCDCESTYGDTMLEGKLSIEESPCCPRCCACFHTYCGLHFNSNDKRCIKCHWLRGCCKLGWHGGIYGGGAYLIYAIITHA